MHQDRHGPPSPAGGGVRPPPRALRRLPRIVTGRRRWLMARLLAWGAARAFAGFALAWLLRRVAGEAAAGDAAAAPALAALLAIGVALLALRIGERADAEDLGQDYVTKVRLRLFARLAASPLRDGARPTLGITLARMIGDLGALRLWVSRGLAGAVVAAVTLSGSLVSLWLLAPGAFVAVAALVGVVLAVAAGATRGLRRRVREVRRQRGRLASHLGDVVPALASVVHLGQTRREWRRLRRRSRALASASVRRAVLESAVTALPDAAFPVGVAVLAQLCLAGHFGWDEMLGALALLGLISASLRDLMRAWRHRLAFEEGRRRLTALLTSPRRRRRVSGLPAAALAVELRDVSLGSLRAAGVRLVPGERVAVTGCSGAGKSALLALLAGLCEPDAGDVRLGGVSIRAMAPEQVGAAVQLVSPEAPLLRGTVAGNIGYGVRGDPAAVARAARQCDIDADCLASRVDDGGRNLPGGLRARVALARALAVSPRLLLIDDPVLLADEGSRCVLAEVVGSAPCTVLVAGDGAGTLPVDRVLRLTDGRLHEEGNARAGTRHVVALAPAG